MSDLTLNYEDLSELQIAVAQNEAADLLLTIHELIQATQELYANHTTTSSSSSQGEGTPDSHKTHALFKGLIRLKRVVVTPKRLNHSSSSSSSTSDKKTSNSSAPSSPAAARTPTKVFCAAFPPLNGC